MASITGVGFMQPGGTNDLNNKMSSAQQLKMEEEDDADNQQEE